MSEAEPEPLSGSSSEALAFASLQGQRVLVVEDDYLFAEDLHAKLEQQGAEVIGPVTTVAGALDLLRQESAPHVAILDIKLQGEKVYPVADALRALGIRFVFATCYDTWAFPEAYADVPRVEKPVKYSISQAHWASGG